MSVRTTYIGTLPYLNVLPFFVEEIFKGYHVFTANPRTLSGSLRSGTVSAAPIPVVDLWRFADHIVPLANLGIAAQEQTHSVLLFSKVPPTELAGVPIAVTPESSTSVCMLWILLREKWRIKEPCLQREISARTAVLLIGNTALRQHKILESTGYQVYDLAKAWYDLTGQSFVFAQWAVHQEVPEIIRADIRDRLQRALEYNLNHLSALYKSELYSTFLTLAEFLDYLQQFSYSFTDKELQGMQLFKSKVMEYGLFDMDI